MRISDWSSDLCSSDLPQTMTPTPAPAPAPESPGVESPETTEQTPTVTASATRRTVPRPTIYTRKQWGADESWKNGSPRYTDMMKQVHVHQTVNANDYRYWQTAGILRGITRYHTKTLGWFRSEKNTSELQSLM